MTVGFGTPIRRIVGHGRGTCRGVPCSQNAGASGVCYSLFVPIRNRHKKGSGRISGQFSEGGRADTLVADDDRQLAPSGGSAGRASLLRPSDALEVQAARMDRSIGSRRACETERVGIAQSLQRRSAALNGLHGASEVERAGMWEQFGDADRTAKMGVVQNIHRCVELQQEGYPADALDQLNVTFQSPAVRELMTDGDEEDYADAMSLMDSAFGEDIRALTGMNPSDLVWAGDESLTREISLGKIRERQERGAKWRSHEGHYPEELRPYVANEALEAVDECCELAEAGIGDEAATVYAAVAEQQRQALKCAMWDAPLAYERVDARLQETLGSNLPV